MRLALCGLHGVGKSFIASLLEHELGWKNIYKRDLLRKMHAESGEGGNWEHWYLEQYRARGIHAMTEAILDLVPTGDVVLDAVHNPLEWDVVKRRHPSARLALVVASLDVRRSRRSGDQEVANRGRIEYWHETNSCDQRCLPSMADFSFNGAAPVEVILAEARALISVVA